MEPAALILGLSSREPGPGGSGLSFPPSLAPPPPSVLPGAYNPTKFGPSAALVAKVLQTRPRAEGRMIYYY